RKAKSRINGGPPHGDQALSRVTRENSRPNPTRLLDLDASAALRDRLVAELNDLRSGEQAATWGLQALAAKNTLLPADARRVESSFQVQLAKQADAGEEDP